MKANDHPRPPAQMAVGCGTEKAKLSSRTLGLNRLAETRIAPSSGPERSAGFGRSLAPSLHVKRHELLADDPLFAGLFADVTAAGYLGAESDRQAEEWSGEAHAVCPLWPTLVAGTGQTNAKAWEPPPHPRPKCPEGMLFRRYTNPEKGRSGDSPSCSVNFAGR